MIEDLITFTFINSKSHHFFSIIRPSRMVDTSNVLSQMELNANLGLKDFYLVEHANGMVEYSGSLSLERVQEILKNKIVQEGTMDTSRWLPASDPPKLPASIEIVMKKPDMLKHAAGEHMAWMLSSQGLQKPGDDGFLGWAYPVRRDLFLFNSKSLSSFKGNYLSMEEIVPWSRLKNLKNGFQAGARTLLLPNSGVQAWLGFLRIFLEVGICL